MAHLLGCERVSVQYPTKRPLHEVTLSVSDGDRIGVVGDNGDGKSTLLKVLAGVTAPTAGSVVPRTGLRIGMLGQSDELSDDTTARDVLTLGQPQHLWAADPSVRAILDGLTGCVPWDSPIGTLSGGQRRRVDLARTLMGDWDILMLDEPTNHLDLHSITWLASHLNQRWSRGTGALLVISHDRWFLDEVCTTMWEVHDGAVDSYAGGYSEFLVRRVERSVSARKAEQKRQNLARRELAWLARGPRARGTKPKFRVAAAQQLTESTYEPAAAVQLKRTAISRLGKKVVELTNVSVSYDNRTVLDQITWTLGPGDRIGILGPNGSGKTTLLDVISGAAPPHSGTVDIGPTVRFAVLSQRLDELQPYMESRVSDVLREHKSFVEIDGKQFTPSQLLDELGFPQGSLSSVVHDLSGGQQRRLQLMLLLMQAPNVLILDEPDNDLDTDMLAALEGVLESWPGSLVLISHDRNLIERATEDQYALHEGKLVHLPGGVDEYLRTFAVTSGQTNSPWLHSKSCDTTPTATCRQDGSVSQTGARQRSGAETHRLRKEYASIERKLVSLTEVLQSRRAALDTTDPTDFQGLLDAQAAIDLAVAEIDNQEARWLELSEILNGTDGDL